MNKSQLISAVSDKTDITKSDVEVVIASVINTIEDAVKSGDQVQLIGFGTFKPIKRAARTGNNPQTGKTMKIPAKIVPKFVPGSKFKNMVNIK